MPVKKTIPNDPMRCEMCRHFVQHYVYHSEYRTFVACDCGHCLHPRLKSVTWNHTCERFEDAKPSPRHK